MAIKFRAVFAAVETYCRSKAGIRDCQVGEPTSPPDDMTAAVMMHSVRIPKTNLTGPEELRFMLVRLYLDAGLEGARVNVEQQIMDKGEELFAALLTDIDLSGDATAVSGVREISPTECYLEYGYQQIGRRWFRTADCVLALIVDDDVVFGSAD